MAQLPKPEEQKTAGASNPGTYWKAGMGKKPVQTVIANRVVREGQEAGPAAGRFANTVDIPFDVNGRPFTATISTKSKDYAALLGNLGPDGAKWIGATILIQDDPNLEGAFHVAYIGGP